MLTPVAIGRLAETIAARNFARMVAAGTAAHSDHGRGVAEIFLLAAKGEVEGYGIKDEQKLIQLGLDFDIDPGLQALIRFCHLGCAPRFPFLDVTLLAVLDPNIGVVYCFCARV